MSNEFNKRTIDHYLYEIAKEYKRLNKNSPDAEIILVGGASVIINYNLREMTTDIDVLIRAASNMKDAINVVGERNDLQDNWINEDFKQTSSYSPKLVEHSKYYRQFYGLTVRTISGAYLVAMKIKAGRVYKKDLSDLIGIIYESKESGNAISYDDVNKAMIDLYGGWENTKDYIKRTVQKIFEVEDLQTLYHETIEKELRNRETLLSVKDMKSINEGNVDDFLYHQNTEECNSSNFTEQRE